MSGIRFVVTALCIASLDASSAGAQTNTATVSVARDITRRVATEVAQQWRVDPARVVLQWGHVRGAATMAPDTPFEIRGRAAGTNFTVVFTPAQGPPVAAQLRAGLRTSIPVTTRPLPTGHTIAEADVAWGDWTLWDDDVHQRPTDELPVGWRVRSSIAAGNPVRPPMAVPPPIVNAGAAVEVLWVKGAIAVQVAGVAMHDATVGQHVRVRLDHGRGNVRGVVNADGRVELLRN